MTIVSNNAHRGKLPYKQKQCSSTTFRAIKKRPVHVKPEIYLNQMFKSTQKT